MSKIVSITDTPSTPSRKTQLDDATSAFFFSRLPREERIAKTIYWLVAGTLEPAAEDARYFVQFKNYEDVMDLATKLAPYAGKDFAVRPGRLDGAAQDI